MSRLVTTFPVLAEFEKARIALDELRLQYEVVQPGRACARVGVPAVVADQQARMILAARHRDDFTCSGWVDFRPTCAKALQEGPSEFPEDIFGEARIMVLAPCVADLSKIRLIAHISGDLAEVFPYLNTEMQQGCYNQQAPALTYMDRYRMVSLYPRRITIAKADEIVDAWHTLEAIRRRVNDVWARRNRIAPSYEMREKPPALEIFKRLPRTNCRVCGEATCLAFALKVWQGIISPSECKPVVSGEYAHLRDALLEICRGLGVAV